MIKEKPLGGIEEDIEIMTEINQLCKEINQYIDPYKIKIKQRTKRRGYELYLSNEDEIQLNTSIKVLLRFDLIYCENKEKIAEFLTAIMKILHKVKSSLNS